MSMTRLKIIEGDSAEITEGKVNHFLASDKVYAVVFIQTKPKHESDGFYCYITYKEKYNRESDNEENS